MTIEELEKYCLEQSMKCVEKSKDTDQPNEERYYAGQANAFMWVAAVIQQNREVKTAH